MNAGSPFRDAAPGPPPPPASQAKARAALAKHVPANEELVWAGQPAPGAFWKTFREFDALFGLAWLVFGAGFAFSTVSSSLLMALVGSGFALGGMWHIFAPPITLYLRHARTFYGITASRALVLERRRTHDLLQTSLRSWQLALHRTTPKLGSIHLEDDVLVTGGPPDFSGKEREPTPMRFERLRDVDEAFRHLEALNARPRD